MKTLILVAPFILSLVLKTLLYIVVFRVQKHNVAIIKSFLLAGSSFLGVGLGLSLLHPPEFVQWLIGMGAAVFILAKFTEVDILPEGVTIIFGVELTAAIILRFLIFPFLPD